MNIVHLYQQKRDGRISNPYIYIQNIYHPYQSSTTTTTTLWKPSRTRSIQNAATSVLTYNRNITTHMDLFHNNNNNHSNSCGTDTDQFLITIQNKQRSGHDDNEHCNNHNTIAIYNLWEPEHYSSTQQQQQQQKRLQPNIEDNDNIHLKFHPIQKTLFTTHTSSSQQQQQQQQRPSSNLFTLSGIQWYPIDTGTFITSTISTNGYITLWDTNHMIPVLNCQPYMNVHPNPESVAITNTTTRNSTLYSSSSSRSEQQRPIRGRGLRNMGWRERVDPIGMAYVPVARGTASNSVNSSAGITTMHIGILQPYLVATGSHRSDMTKIVDLRSGTTSHTLMIGSHTSFMYNRDDSTNTSKKWNVRGVTSVQWSPIQSNTLATCTNGNCYLWDIRSTIQPIAICTNHNPSGTKDDAVSSACYAMDEYLSQNEQQRKSTKQIKQRHGRTTLPSNIQHKPQQQHVAAVGHEIYETLQFDYTGQYLITLSKEFQRPNETHISVFDLLSSSSSSSSSSCDLPMYPSCRTFHTYISESEESNRAAILRPPKSLLFITGQKPMDQKIWIASSSSSSSTRQSSTESSVRSYPMLLPDRHLDDDDDDDIVTNNGDVLTGHMGRIRCGVVMTGPNRIRQRSHSGGNRNTTNTYAPYTIITAAEDGLTLIWEQQQRTGTGIANAANINETGHNYKRRRLSMHQQQQQPLSSSTGDYDTW